MSAKKITAGQLLENSGASPLNCMKCGRCTAACPAAADMDLFPHEIVAELGSGSVARAIGADSPWQCLSCFACVERCPRGVKPAYALEALRSYRLRQKNPAGPAPAEEAPEKTLGATPGKKIPQQLLVSLYRKLGKA